MGAASLVLLYDWLLSSNFIHLLSSFSKMEKEHSLDCVWSFSVIYCDTKIKLRKKNLLQNLSVFLCIQNCKPAGNSYVTTNTAESWKNRINILYDLWFPVLPQKSNQAVWMSVIFTFLPRLTSLPIGIKYCNYFEN